MRETGVFFSVAAHRFSIFLLGLLIHYDVFLKSPWCFFKFQFPEKSSICRTFFSVKVVVVSLEYWHGWKAVLVLLFIMEWHTHKTGLIERTNWTELTGRTNWTDRTTELNWTDRTGWSDCGRNGLHSVFLSRSNWGNVRLCSFRSCVKFTLLRFISKDSVVSVMKTCDSKWLYSMTFSYPLRKRHVIVMGSLSCDIRVRRPCCESKCNRWEKYCPWEKCLQGKIPELEQWQDAWAKSASNRKPQTEFTPFDSPWKRPCFNSGTLPCTYN